VKALVIDSAAPVVGVAGFADGRTWVRSATVPRGAEAWLALAVREVLAEVGTIDVVGVAIGPGTFTGVRVGLAMALGLAVARSVPVAPVSSLALRAALVPGRARVLALLDARKGRVYAGSFDTRGAVPVALGAEVDAAPELAIVGSGVAIGEGAVAYAGQVQSAGLELADDAGATPAAAAWALVRATPWIAPEQVAPVYLREPDAVRGGG
jgi:tRNA threonylcarbamoyladenosine biosynthesis protein TsaB